MRHYSAQDHGLEREEARHTDIQGSRRLVAQMHHQLFYDAADRHGVTNLMLPCISTVTPLGFVSWCHVSMPTCSAIEHEMAVQSGLIPCTYTLNDHDVHHAAIADQGHAAHMLGRSCHRPTLHLLRSSCMLLLDCPKS